MHCILYLLLDPAFSATCAEGIKHPIVEKASEIKATNPPCGAHPCHPSGLLPPRVQRASRTPLTRRPRRSRPQWCTPLQPRQPPAWWWGSYWGAHWGEEGEAAAARAAAASGDAAASGCEAAKRLWCGGDTSRPAWTRPGLSVDLIIVGGQAGRLACTCTYLLTLPLLSD